MLYKINISTSLPADTPEVSIKARFGPGKGPNEWGVQFAGIPGVNGTIEGPVDTNLTKDGVTARAGLFDEPFFFDLQGFRESRAMGTLRFKNTRNFFDGQNDTALVLEIPKDRFASATTPLGFWITTARYGGSSNDPLDAHRRGLAAHRLRGRQPDTGAHAHARSGAHPGADGHRGFV